MQTLQQEGLTVQTVSSVLDTIGEVEVIQTSKVAPYNNSAWLYKLCPVRLDTTGEIEVIQTSKVAPYNKSAWLYKLCPVFFDTIGEFEVIQTSKVSRYHAHPKTELWR